MNDWLRAYQWAQRGVLPEPGGMLDQSAFIVEVFDLIEQETARLANG